jgi:hypothetical protein
VNHKHEVQKSLVEDLQITKQKVIKKKQQNINKNKATNKQTSKKKANPLQKINTTPIIIIIS